jgi:HlyD family secretion protein
MTTPHRIFLPAIAVLAVAGLLSCTSAPRVRGSGTIELDEIDVASLVGGRIVHLAVSEGDTVRAGDTLAVLTRGEIAAELAAQLAQSQLAAAQADRRLADTQFARTEKLVKSQAVAQAELDRARATRDAAVARERAASEQLRLQEQGFRRLQVDAAKSAATAAMAQLAGARSRAGELVLTAPVDGVVLLRNFEDGELVPPSVPVLTLGDPDRLWIRVFVAAPLLASIRLGDAVEVTPTGAKRAFTGRVVQIASRAEFTPRAALTEEEQANLVFGVKIALDPTQGTLKPGLPAEARFTTVQTKR